MPNMGFLQMKRVEIPIAKFKKDKCQNSEAVINENDLLNLMLQNIQHFF